MALLSVYAKREEELVAEIQAGFAVPDPVLRLSGQCVLLRDLSPNDFDIGAYSVDADAIQKKLFGNPLEHFMIEYRARVYRVLGEEPLKTD